MKRIMYVPGLVLMFILVVSCTTIQDAPPYTYTGDKPIYPAVHHAIVNGNATYWKNSQATVPDPNTIIVEHVYTSDGLKLADFTLKISLINNVVTYQFSDIREKLPNGSGSDWTKVGGFTQPNRELLFTSYFNTEIPKVMENETLYAQAKEAADKSLGGSPGGGALSYSLALQNPQNYLMYPAVASAFTSLGNNLLGKTAYMQDIYCLDNEFTIKGCVAERKPGDLIAYQIKISAPDNNISIDFTNIDSIGSYIIQYSDAEVEALPRFDTQKIADQLKAQIEQSLASPAAYGNAKKAFLANNAFLKRAFSPVTNAMMDEFVATVFTKDDLSLNASILNVNKNDKAEFSNYATAINAGLYTGVPSSNAFAFITLYTNDASLTRLRQYEETTLNGQLVRVEKGPNGNPLFIITK